MGTLFGRKKYTNFFSYAKEAVIVLSVINRKKDYFTTKQFVKAFEALRSYREKEYIPGSDKQSTQAIDTLRSLTEMNSVERIRIGYYHFNDFVENDSRKFNNVYRMKKDPTREKQRRQRLCEKKLQE